jgi:LytTr DNA-binding domain
MQPLVLGRERLMRAMAIIGAWLMVAAGALGLAALRAGAAGHFDRIIADATTQLAIIPIWAVATPFILSSAERWRVRTDGLWRPLGAHFVAGTIFVLVSNAIIRLPLMAGGASTFFRDLAVGLSIYYVPALLAYGAIVGIGHLLAWRRTSRESGADSPPAGRETLTIVDRARTTLVPYAEIEWIEAEDNYAIVHAGTRSYTARTRIGDLERLLEGNGFARVHRSAIVRLAEVRQVRRLPHGDFDVVLAGGAVVRGSRSRKSALGAFTEEAVNA